MTTHEQMTCEIQADLFELSTEKFSCSSPFFISRYMQSDIVKELDNVDDPYNFLSPHNLIVLMNSNYPSLKKKKGLKYPKPVIRWIGYMYRAYALIKKEQSKKIYESLPAEKMLTLYETFHTFSTEYCVEQLEGIISQNKKTVDEYALFKKVMQMK